jgi:DNA-binding NarL/FixJ family response regulator
MASHEYHRAIDSSVLKHDAMTLIAPEGLEALPFNVDADGYVLLTFRTSDKHASIRGAKRLTESERAVVALVLEGHSNSEIARVRGTSARTVANQISAIYRKLAVKSRRELGATAKPRETSSRRRDPIAILESAYSLYGNEQEWLNQLGATFRKNLDDDRWLVAYTYDARQPDVALTRTCCGVNEQDVILSTTRLFAPMLDYEPKEAFFRIPFVSTLRQFPEGYRRSQVDEGRVREFERILEQWLRDSEMADELWINAQDPTGIGCCVGAPMRRVGLTPREKHRWSCIGAHVATAFRIRRQFSTSSSATDGTSPTPEAIFRGNGKLEHAEGPASSVRARSALHEAVRALDRARGPLRRRDPEEAVETWRALVAGRWSLLDHFDSDGRRFVVAHRNDARIPDMRGLSSRERQVLAYAALGHSNKVIAYELGLSISTVSGHLARGRAKLQLSSGAALCPNACAAALQ